jgi:tetratricopeptide (TPR) repeat protein
LPEGVEAVSLLGDTLRPPPLSDAAREDREANFAEALTAYEANPNDADAIIWLGRRTAYLGRYREAIEVFTEGITKHPNDARMYRHRGHRYISVRMFPNAIADFEKATSLIAGQPDEVEQDGLPNARNIPTSTLQSNIWYHLGLAHYLARDYENAARAYAECMEVSNNPDMFVATSYWYYMTLRRLGRTQEAAAVLEQINADMDIIENGTYQELLLLFKGEKQPQDVMDTSGDADVPLSNATVGYGVGTYFAFMGAESQAEMVWRQVLEGSQWSGFGYIAAEAEVQLLQVGL